MNYSACNINNANHYQFLGTPFIPFFKMQGCGNDFVLIDNRELQVPVTAMADWARAVCPRAIAVGADGLIFLERTEPGHAADYRWHFYNADGSRAEMCGNASRCAARLAVWLGLAGPEHVLDTDAGPIRVRVAVDSDVVRVQLTDYTDLNLSTCLRLHNQDFVVHFVNTGVPHALVLLESTADLATLDIKTYGPALRQHQYFNPEGINANFGYVTDYKNILLRTFERGVEGETLACGTGAAAAVVIGHALGLTDTHVAVTTSGGEIMNIIVKNLTTYIEGRAVLVYVGQILLTTLGLSL
ncbi:Diaminopimelate epimerase [Desulfovibrionales bacterium]